MSEFEELVQKLLDQKPELTRQDVDDQIKKKKDKIGAGYLTDQGALFLIASDYGVSLSAPLKVEMGLKDLYAGAKEISLETRVLSVSPAKQYSRKDGSPFFWITTISPAWFPAGATPGSIARNPPNCWRPCC